MKIKPLLQSIDASNFIEQYLTACGVEDVEDYLCADLNACEDPWLYPNMKQAVDRLHDAITNNEKIGLVVDCDADGYCSASLIHHFIKRISHKQDIVCFYHVGKQHGLSQSKEEDIVQQVIDSKVNLMIVPDAGSNDEAQCTTLKAHGIDCLILDHHEITVENPNAIIINHHLGKGLNTSLSGTGVVYKFVKAYCNQYGIYLGEAYLDLVATSLVTDNCNMTHPENFAYVKAGFDNMTNPMLKAMYKAFNTRGDTPNGVAWGTGPKINAVCRGNNMELKEHLFKALSQEYKDEDKIEEVIELLGKNHKEQSEIVEKLVKKIRPTLDLSHKVLVGYIEPEFKGNSGLIANKLTGEYNKPSLILREQSYGWRKPVMLTGSMRSPVDVAQRINESGLATCQGHLSACGIWFPKDNLDELIRWFDKQDLASESIKPVTAKLTPQQVTLGLCHACSDDMVMWGGSDSSGIPQPKFYLSFEVNPMDVIVYAKRTKTVKFSFGNVSVLKFRAKKEDVDLLMSGKCRVEVLSTLSVNEWNGVESPQCQIEEWEINRVEEKDVSETSWEDLF